MTEPSDREPERRPRPSWPETLKRAVGHPLTQLSVAILLMATSLIEASTTFVDDVSNFRVRATHGLLIVGLWQVLGTIPDLIEGVERYLESRGGHEREP